MADIAFIPRCQALVKGKVNETEENYSTLCGQQKVLR